MKTIIMTHAADKQLRALPQEAENHVAKALEQYAISGVGDVKALVNRPGFRLRIGRYRVLFTETRDAVTVVYVGKRETNTY